MQRLVQQQHHGVAAEKVAENILEDLFTEVLDRPNAGLDNQVGPGAESPGGECRTQPSLAICARTKGVIRVRGRRGDAVCGGCPARLAERPAVGFLGRRRTSRGAVVDLPAGHLAAVRRASRFRPGGACLDCPGCNGRAGRRSAAAPEVQNPSRMFRTCRRCKRSGHLEDALPAGGRSSGSETAANGYSERIHELPRRRGGRNAGL